MEALFHLQKATLSSLNDLRIRGQLCDLTLTSKDNVPFSLHTIVAAASSGFFHTYFTTGKLPKGPLVTVDEDSMYLKDVSSDVLQMAIEFMYGILPGDLADIEILEEFAEKYQLVAFERVRAIYDLDVAYKASIFGEMLQKEGISFDDSTQDSFFQDSFQSMEAGHITNESTSIPNHLLDISSTELTTDTYSTCSSTSFDLRGNKEWDLEMISTWPQSDNLIAAAEDIDETLCPTPNVTAPSININSGNLESLENNDSELDLDDDHPTPTPDVTTLEEEEDVSPGPVMVSTPMMSPDVRQIKFFKHIRDAKPVPFKIPEDKSQQCDPDKCLTQNESLHQADLEASKVTEGVRVTIYETHTTCTSSEHKPSHHEDKPSGTKDQSSPAGLPVAAGTEHAEQKEANERKARNQATRPEPTITSKLESVPVKDKQNKEVPLSEEEKLYDHLAEQCLDSVKVMPYDVSTSNVKVLDTALANHKDNEKECNGNLEEETSSLAEHVSESQILGASMSGHTKADESDEGKYSDMKALTEVSERMKRLDEEMIKTSPPIKPVASPDSDSTDLDEEGNTERCISPEAVSSPSFHIRRLHQLPDARHAQFMYQGENVLEMAVSDEGTPDSDENYETVLVEGADGKEVDINEDAGDNEEKMEKRNRKRFRVARTKYVFHVGRRPKQSILTSSDQATKIKKARQPTFACKVCKEVWYTLGELQEHNLSEHTIRNQLYACDECHFKTLEEAELQEHQLIEHQTQVLGTQVHQCYSCTFTSSSQDAVHEHQQQEHDMASTHYQGDGPTNQLVQMQTTHQVICKPYKCSYCNAAYSHSTKLHEHKRLVHLEKELKPYKCGYCPFFTSQRTNCRQHIKRCHADNPVYIVDTGAYGHSETTYRYCEAFGRDVDQKYSASYRGDSYTSRNRVTSNILTDGARRYLTTGP